MNKLALSLAIALCAAAAPAGAVAVFLDPAKAVVGNAFDVELKVSGLGSGAAPSVGTFDVTLGFDPTAVAFQSVAVGSVLGGPLQRLDGVFPAPASVRAFSVSLLAPADLDALQGSDATLATFRFDALSRGTTSIDFSAVLLGDAFGVRLYPESVTGASFPIIPEPGAALLFALGAAVVGARLRWRRGR